jgi:hypothetical protein
MPPKGEFEVIYVPSKGLDFSRPYNTIDKEYLAPGSVNTQSINGFLCSSPWVAASPYSTNLASNEVVIGRFTWAIAQGFASAEAFTIIIIVTNIAVYISNQASLDVANPKTQGTLTVVHTWGGGEINTAQINPGNLVSFIELQPGPTGFLGIGGSSKTVGIVSVVYMTGLMLSGVFQLTVNAGGFFTFTQSTTYVAGRYIAELGGRLIIGEAIFPTGGGPFGNQIAPVIAWSGVGSYSGSGATDPWNPANFATLNGNVGGFNLLSDVPDQITGLATQGRSALIARENGLTQQDPGPSGIDPFIWYHLWSWTQGEGSFNNCFIQYGSTVYMLARENVYILSLQGGLNAIGVRIIPRIRQLLRDIGLTLSYQNGYTNIAASPSGNSSGVWVLGSVVNIAGQLHYLLSVNSFASTGANLGNPLTATCNVFDYNVSEDAWHEWDFTKYYTSSTNAAGFFLMTTPPEDTVEVFTYNGSSNLRNPVVVKLRYLLFGGIQVLAVPNPGAGSQTAPTGALFQLVSLDYDANDNPYPVGGYWSNYYQPLSAPAPTIKFRGENVALGHPVAQRRLRIQSTNAPFFATVASYQGQVNVTFSGSQQGSQTTPVPVNLGTPTVIENDYADVRLLDQMVQASIVPVITGGTPWKNLPLLRLATVSMVGMDPRGTTP